MEPKDIARILRTSSLAGAEKHLSLIVHRVNISKAAAYRLYGRSNIDRWIAEGLISNNSKNLNRQALADVARASNRITYLDSKER